MTKYFVLVFLGGLGGKLPVLAGILILVVADVLNTAIWVMIIAIIVQAVMSWFVSGNYSPVNEILNDLTSPVLRPIRRFLPALGGIDFSPIVAMIGLNFLQILLVNSLRMAAAGLM